MPRGEEYVRRSNLRDHGFHGGNVKAMLIIREEQIRESESPGCGKDEA